MDGIDGSECGNAEEEGLGTQPSTTQAVGDCNNTPDLGQVGEVEDEMGVGEEGADGPVVTDLVDADNGFNHLNRFAMLWTVRHCWASMARFTFNMHRHFVRLVLRVPGKAPHILQSREGVIQGDPTSSYNYGVGLLPWANGSRLNIQQLPVRQLPTTVMQHN